MSKITYTDKVALNSNSDIADIHKCNASDMNLIKKVVNELISMFGLDKNPFSETKTYAVNDVVTKDYILFKCHTAVTTAGEWTGSENWEETSILVSDSFMSSLNVNRKLLPLKKHAETEQAVGIWVNGKTIYRQSIILSGTSSRIISTDIEDVIYSHCEFCETSDAWRPIPWLFSEGGNIGAGSWAGGFYISAAGNLTFQVGTNLGNISRGIFIIEYTKTTD